MDKQISNFSEPECCLGMIQTHLNLHQKCGRSDLSTAKLASGPKSRFKCSARRGTSCDPLKSMQPSPPPASPTQAASILLRSAPQKISSSSAKNPLHLLSRFFWPVFLTLTLDRFWPGPSVTVSAAKEATANHRMNITDHLSLPYVADFQSCSSNERDVSPVPRAHVPKCRR